MIYSAKLRVFFGNSPVMYSSALQAREDLKKSVHLEMGAWLCCFYVHCSDCKQSEDLVHKGRGLCVSQGLPPNIEVKFTLRIWK